MYMSTKCCESIVVIIIILLFKKHEVLLKQNKILNKLKLGGKNVKTLTIKKRAPSREALAFTDKSIGTKKKE